MRCENKLLTIIKEWEQMSRSSHGSHNRPEEDGFSAPLTQRMDDEKDTPPELVRSNVYLDFSVDLNHSQRVIVETFNDIAPLAAENFVRLCAGNVEHPLYDYKLSYKGCKVFRVVEGAYLVSGDVENNSGLGNFSAMGPETFREYTDVQVTVPGTVYMNHCHGQYCSVGSQFIITTAPCHSFVNKYVPVGRVVRGLDSVEAIVHSGTASGAPTIDVAIASCGVLQS